MKALILSVRPYWAYLMWKLLKSLELRKRLPKWLNIWVYVYVTIRPQDLKKIPKEHQEMVKSWFGKVPFRFWFDEYEEIKTYRVDDDLNICDDGYLCYDGCNFSEGELEMYSRLDYGDLIDYLGTEDGLVGYAWHIKNLDIFDKPMELSEFAKPRKSMKQENVYWIHKAPQSYMYAWIREEK